MNDPALTTASLGLPPLCAVFAETASDDNDPSEDEERTLSSRAPEEVSSGLALPEPGRSGPVCAEYILSILPVRRDEEGCSSLPAAVALPFPPAPFRLKKDIKPSTCPLRVLLLLLFGLLLGILL